MSTHYLFGSILTRQAVAANNRGDNIGNTATLQKVFLNDDEHTAVSAESIRWAIRYRFQLQGLLTNRTFNPATNRLHYEDEARVYWDPVAGGRIDDDLLGFMNADAALAEKEDEDAPEEATETAPKEKAKKKGPKPKNLGSVTKRPSPLSVSKAVSIRPYRGEVSFNCVSGEKGVEKSSRPGAKALSLYGTEIHTTEYQYSFGLNLGDVMTKSRITDLVEAIIDPPQVAGNHARFAYDFSPATIVLCVTSRHSSRIALCFAHDPTTRGVTMRQLIRVVKSGDVPAEEVILGGELADSEEGKALQALGVFVTPSVDDAARQALRRIAALGLAYQHIVPMK